MGQNYLHGVNSPKINALLAASAWNFKKLMEKLKKELQNFLFSVLQKFFLANCQILKVSY